MQLIHASWLLLACCGQACRGAARRATFVPPVFQGSASQGTDAVCIVAASEHARHTLFLATPRLPSTASSRACSVRRMVSAGAGHDDDDFAHMNIRVARAGGSREQHMNIPAAVAGGEAGGSREQVAQALAGYARLGVAVCICMCVCVCVYLYVCVCVNTHTHTHTHTHTPHSHTCAHIHTHTHACAHTQGYGTRTVLDTPRSMSARTGNPQIQVRGRGPVGGGQTTVGVGRGGAGRRFVFALEGCVVEVGACVRINACMYIDTYILRPN